MIKDPDGLTQPIIDIYNQIEYDLIIDIAKRFDTYDTIGGTLEWQLKKLDELGTLNADMVKTIAKYSKKSQKEIYDMLKSAGFANIDFEDLQKAYSAGAILVDPVTIRNNTVFAELVERSYKELDKTFRMIQTKALESAKQSYMDVINRAYIEVATGTYDYNTSIRNAIQRMAENGITGATYKRGGKIVNYSLEATVRRDTLTAVHKLANQSSEVICDEVGTDYVEISSHLGARVHLTNKIANHAGWQGKVYKIHGEDPEYPNLKESTGYPGDILGLGGVNCRHRMFPFVPGISTPNPINFSEEENRKAYELSQQQRKLERDMRKLKKKKAAAKASGDKETEKKLKEKIKLKSDEIDKFCEDNKLKRDYNRELVTEQISKKVAKAENDGIIDVEIDELVPCLRDTSTGKLVETEVSEIARKSLEKYTTENGWIINWADRPKEEHIFGVFVKGDNNPQGLVSLRYERGGTYVALAVNAPQNNKLLVGDSIKYKGVGGHLFAVAVEESIKNSGYGTIYGYASNKTVLEHYIEQFGAKHLPIRHRYQFLIEGKDSEKLLKTYNYERRV